MSVRLAGCTRWTAYAGLTVTTVLVLALLGGVAVTALLLYAFAQLTG